MIIPRPPMVVAGVVPKVAVRETIQNTIDWQPRQPGWHSRRHRFKPENLSEGSDTVPNPDRTEANRKKQNKTNAKAKAAGILTRAELRAVKQKKGDAEQ